jgi:glyoxylase-like metal-dependent hydrolase (beta-lactamase superfamily II)
MRGVRLTVLGTALFLAHAVGGCEPDPVRKEAEAQVQQSTIQVTRLNDHLLFFFDGRELYDGQGEGGWVGDTAMKLGVGTYVIHRGDEALVYDTFTTVEQARWVRRHLEGLGIRRFTVALSHWHLDHVAGNLAYRDSTIISSALTRTRLIENKEAIESGELWGPPPIKPLVLPTLTFEGQLKLHVGDIEVELRQVNIHSQDSTIVFLPQDKIALVGDTMEDPLTFMVEVEGLATHVAGLKKLREMDLARIFPNHGDPAVIAQGGYDKTFIDATVDYISKMVSRAHDPDYLSGTVEDYLADSFAKGWLHPYEAYRAVHAMNLQLVHDYYKDRPLPDLSSP